MSNIEDHKNNLLRQIFGSMTDEQKQAMSEAGGKLIDDYLKKTKGETK